MDDFEIPDIIPEQDIQGKTFDDDLYKKWFKKDAQTGFLSIRPWLEAHKIVIDIGRASGEGGLQSNTVCFVDAYLLGTYLHAVVDGRAAKLYAKYEKGMIPTDEGLTVFGGGKKDGQPISRIFKSHHWQTGKDFSAHAFVWKCGMFGAEIMKTGAYKPLLDQPLSTDSIQVTRKEIAEISYRLDQLLFGYAARTKDWYKIND